VTLQIVRDWVMKFNAYGPNGLIDKKAPGQRASKTALSRSSCLFNRLGGRVRLVGAPQGRRPETVAPSGGGHPKRFRIREAVAPMKSPRWIAVSQSSFACESLKRPYIMKSVLAVSF
jgi:hypothetical protein